jgi:hypothetical protein
MMLVVPVLFNLSTRVWQTSGGVRSALGLLVAVTVGTLILFGPGLALLVLLARRWSIGGLASRVAVAAVGSAAIYWGVWWIWVLQGTLGKAVALGAWLVTVWVLGEVIGQRERSLTPVIQALGIAGAVALASIGLLTLHGGLAVSPDVAAGSTYQTADNMFPQQWVFRVEHGMDLREPALGWPLVERPPLQAAWIMPAMSISANKMLAYEVLSAVLQALAATAAAVLLLSMGLRRWRHLAAMSLVVLTLFFFFNTAFVWPKLLPAALLLMPVAMLLEVGSRLQPLGWVTVVGALAVSAMAHPGGLFAIPVLVVVALRERAWPRGREPVVAGVLAGGVVLAPWVIYQLVHDRSTSELLKWHLAGVSSREDGRSLVRAVLDEYRDAGLSGWVSNKWGNVKTLFGVDAWQNYTDLKQRWLVANVLAPVWSGGLLIMLAPLFALWRRCPRAIATAAIATIVGYVFWMLVEFGPPAARTSTNQGPYGIFLLGAVALAAVAGVVLHRWLLACAVAVQAVLFLWISYPLGALDGCSVSQMCMSRDYDSTGTSGSSLMPVLALVALVGAGAAALLSYRVSAPPWMGESDVESSVGSPGAPRP